MEKFDRVRFLVIALNAYTKLYESGINGGSNIER